MRVRRREQVCLSCRRAGTGTGFLALCFLRSFKPAGWTVTVGTAGSAAESPKKKKKRVYCYLTIERTWWWWCMFFCLFMCDTAFRYALEKLTCLCLYTGLRLHVSNKLDWIHKVTPVHMYKLYITLTQGNLCCWAPGCSSIQLANQCVCVLCVCIQCLCGSVAASPCQWARGENSIQGMLSLVIISWVTHQQRR